MQSSYSISVHLHMNIGNIQSQMCRFTRFQRVLFLLFLLCRLAVSLLLSFSPSLSLTNPQPASLPLYIRFISPHPRDHDFHDADHHDAHTWTLMGNVMMKSHYLTWQNKVASTDLPHSTMWYSLAVRSLVMSWFHHVALYFRSLWDRDTKNRVRSMRMIKQCSKMYLDWTKSKLLI